MMTWSSLFFNSPSSTLMELVILMHDYVMLTLLSIMITVMYIMGCTLKSTFMFKYFLENHQLETVWTLIPFFLLLFILIPSLNSLYMLDSCLFCGITISITGHQWYWSYNYKELPLFFDSYMTSSKSLLRLIDTDNRLILPSMMPVRFLVSSADVIHSWSVPSFGVKMDAIPGRINQFCMASKRSGIFFGQCSEICGANHSFMPITIEMISFKDFVNMI